MLHTRLLLCCLGNKDKERSAHAQKTFFLDFKFYFYFLSIHEHLYVCLCTMYIAGGLLRPADGIRAPGSEGTGSCNKRYTLCEELQAPRVGSVTPVPFVCKSSPSSTCLLDLQVQSKPARSTLVGPRPLVQTLASVCP